MLETEEDADILILRKGNLEIKDVISNGQRLFKNGELDFKEKFLKESNRNIDLHGEK